MALRYIAVFYQFMAPYPGAAALRGEAVVSGLSTLLQRHCQRISVYTYSGEAQRSDGVVLKTIRVGDLENTGRLHRRLWGEVCLGVGAGFAMVSRHRPFALVSSPSYLSALIIILICRLFRVPYVLDVRDLYPQAYHQAGLVRRSSPIFAVLMRMSAWMYGGAKCILAATEGLRREIRRQARGRPVHCVYNGFPAALADLTANRHERFTLCFHGVLGFFQDIEGLVQLARALRDEEIDVVVIGYGRKAELLTGLDLPNLRFLGKRSFAETISEVARCHVGICLRRGDEISRDAFPVKVWEYLGLRIPSVITPLCEAGAFVEQRGCGIQMPAGDLATLKRNILALRDDPDRLAAMRERCVSAASAFSREHLGMVAARHALQAFRATT